MSEEQQLTLAMDHGSKCIGYKLILKDGSMYTVTDQDMDVYRQSYPHLNMDEQMRKMVSWHYSNDRMRKTKRGIKRSINSWLSSAESMQQKFNSGCTGHKSTRDTSLEQDLNNRDWAL